MTNKNLNITVHMDGDICYTTLSDTNDPALYQVYADVDLNVNLTPMQVTATCNVPFTPAWARYIATDKDGTVKAFSHRPITDPDQSPPTRWVAQKISTLTTLSTVVDRQTPFTHDSDEWLTTLVKLP